MPLPPSSSALTITNPLHLYRTYLATSRLLPDPNQYRAALILQTVYERLLDYTPSPHLNTRLQSLARALDNVSTPLPPRRFFPPLLATDRGSKHLIRVLTTTDQALELTTPQGLLLSGEVGTGKSMLLDILYHSLPTSAKKRWHFNSFMLHIITSLETLRQSRALPGEKDEYSLLRLARATIVESPILFLDEFQMPDRAAAKLLSGLLVGFWGMGGVLVGSSNRRVEDLVKGVGAGRQQEFEGFIDALRARCECWDIGAGKDWRREARGRRWWRIGFSDDSFTESEDMRPEIEMESDGRMPAYYFTPISPPEAWETALSAALNAASPHDPNAATPATRISDLKPATLTVYSRTLHITHAHSGIALFTFDNLCAAPLGPADYITLTSHYHTLFISNIPPLTHADRKNEARRFITLLDAIYESGVRLAISTDVESIDDLFFPDNVLPSPRNEKEKTDWDMSGDSDPLSAEVYAESHQDLTAPFRPNISVYDGSGRSESAPLDNVDFGKTAVWTGEDEKFAYRRAVSRLWEVTGKGWWEGVKWRPSVVKRHWEGVDAGMAKTIINEKIGDSRDANAGLAANENGDGVLFSPYRRHPQEPPRFGMEHFWSVVRWGRRAGNWGKGVEGVEERKNGIRDK